MQQPLISIIIPTHNRAALLKEAIQSVLDQTYQSFEMIVVDDSSTDNTKGIVTSFHDPRIKYVFKVKREGDSGGAVARNIGIKNASGQYVAFLDDDDLWQKEKLAKQMETIKNNPDIKAVSTGYQFVNEKGKKMQNIEPEDWYSDSKKLLTRNWIGITSTVLLEKKALQAIKGFDETLPSCQDWDLWYRFSKQYRIKPLKEMLVTYRVFPKSVKKKSITFNTSSAVRGRELFFEKIKPDLEKQNQAIQAEYYFEEGNFYADIGFFSRARQSYRQAVLFGKRGKSLTLKQWLVQLPLAYKSIVTAKRFLQGRTATIRWN